MAVLELDELHALVELHAYERQWNDLEVRHMIH